MLKCSISKISLLTANIKHIECFFYLSVFLVEAVSEATFFFARARQVDFFLNKRGKKKPYFSSQCHFENHVSPYPLVFIFDAILKNEIFSPLVPFDEKLLLSNTPGGYGGFKIA
ncbi:UNVERIFIED_CONTAM: hypothetical protein NCL1_18176 [Trichonephila clavipes]